jgi:hypothetical protein
MEQQRCASILAALCWLCIVSISQLWQVYRRRAANEHNDATLSFIYLLSLRPRRVVSLTSPPFLHSLLISGHESCNSIGLSAVIIKYDSGNTDLQQLASSSILHPVLSLNFRPQEGLLYGSPISRTNGKIRSRTSRVRQNNRKRVSTISRRRRFEIGDALPTPLGRRIQPHHVFAPIVLSLGWESPMHNFSSAEGS